MRKSIAYFLLIAWYHYFADISWKNVMRVAFKPLILIGIGLKLIVTRPLIVIPLALVAIYGILALVFGAPMWLFEKLFPDSPLFNHRKIPDSFHQELLKTNFQA